METRTNKQKLEAIYDMRDRMIAEIDYLYELAPSVDDDTKCYLSGQVRVYNDLIEFIDDVREGKEV